MSKLPSTWIDVEIGEIAEVIGGGTPNANDVENFTSPGEGIAWLTPADLSGYKRKEIAFGARDLTSQGYQSCSAKLMPKGSLLFSSRAPIGYVAIAANEIATNQGFKSFIFSHGIDPSYAFYYLKSIRHLADSLGTGTTFKEISGATAKTLPFRLAPTAQQTRIAAKLDELLTQVDTLKARIDGIPAQLKRFRQSVLAAATNGTLTESWRQGSKTSFEWQTVTFSDLLFEFRGGASKKPSDLMEGVPVIRSSAVRSMNVDFSDIRHFDTGAELDDRNFVKEGDLLFTRLSGSPEFVGVCARVKTLPKKPTQFPDRLFCARLKDNNNGPFLEIFFSSQTYLDYIRNNLKSSAGHQRITTETVKSTFVLLPPLAEQTEIVRRVEKLFSFADQFEAKIASAKNRIDHLTHSILAKAFRGELVSQDPNDEPASVLLDRIKAQRAVAPKGKRGRRSATMAG